MTSNVPWIKFAKYACVVFFDVFIVSSGSNVNMFSDDIALYRVIKTRDDYIYLQEDVNSISTCIEQKYLQFNTTKCKLMFITRKRANC